jgi:valyl-tRNA synthetase
VKGWEVKPDTSFSIEILDSNRISAEWFESRFNEALREIEEKFADYKLSEALMGIYKLVWDDFCSWYLEMVKPAYQQPIDNTTYQQTISIFEKLMKVVHPFMPFLTEEIWQNLHERKTGESICIAEYPALQTPVMRNLTAVFDVISEIRNLRNSKGLSPKEGFDIAIKTTEKQQYEPYQYLITKLANVSAITFVNEKPENAVSVPVGKDELFVFLTLIIDADAEKEKIAKEIEYLEGFMKSVDAKLANEKFVANAKAELVEKEKQKKADAIAKIEVLKNSLATL